MMGGDDADELRRERLEGLKNWTKFLQWKI